MDILFKLLLSLIPIVHAQVSVKDIDFPKSNFTTLEGLVSGVGNWILGFAGALAVIAVIYSGIMYITAGEDAEKAAKGKKNLTWAIIGILIISLALIIVNTLPKYLGTPGPGTTSELEPVGTPPGNTTPPVTPPTGGDTSPPTAPTNLSALNDAALGKPDVDLTWTASVDDNQIASYEIYRDSALLKRTTATSYKDVGVTTDVNHTYYIVAVDGAGNKTQSQTATIIIRATDLF